MKMIEDLFVYFAKFPLLEGVQKLFRTKTDAAYNALESQIDGLSVHSLIPTLKDYVFGSNINILKNRLKGLTGKFLMVNFGDVSITKTMNVAQDAMCRIEIFVAQVANARNEDDIDNLLIMQDTFDIINSIRRQIEIDDKADRCSMLQYLQHPITIVQIDEKNFYNYLEVNAVGWVMQINSKISAII